MASEPVGQQTDRGVDVEDVLREALAAVSGEAADAPCATAGILADLACDRAFVARADADADADRDADTDAGASAKAAGEWRLEWVAGRLSGPTPAADAAPFPRTAWGTTVVEADRDLALEHLRRALRHGSDRATLRLERPDDGPREYESALRAVALEGGGLRIFGVLRDVTERRATEAALRDAEGRYRTLVDQCSDGILLLGEAGRILQSNDAALDLFGSTRGELHSIGFEGLFESEPEGRGAAALVPSEGAERTVRRRAGGPKERPVWIECTRKALDDGRAQVTLRDVSVDLEIERRIRDLAFFDSVTRLPNRELFGRHIDAAIERARRTRRPFALLFLDVDRFKQVNESLGHTSGDALLRLAADRLRSAVRGSDAVGRSQVDAVDVEAGGNRISRLGGDEFTILLPELEHSQDAARVARRVLHLLARPFTLDDRQVFVSGSIGIAVWPEDGGDAEALMRSAEIAMYHAKERGGNGYEYCDPAMNETSTRRLELETAMRRAIEDQQFVLHYQPIRDARTGRVAAVEALVRWLDENGRLMPPDEFIPIAEETGLIVPLGEWILRTAFDQAMAWRRAGLAPVRMSVNLSPAQLRDVGIVNAVEEALMGSGLSPADVELEITESSILDESPNIVAAIAELTDMGIGFALDDFGTGYSSLSALQRFPIDRIKIDRSFVSGIGESQSDERLASAIVALAQSLDHKVVAEGVENETQARVLTGFGCHELQGYLFAKPMPADEFERFLRRAEKADLAHPRGSR